MKPPRRSTVVFDLGGVLIDWDPRHLYRKLFAGDDIAMEDFFRETGTHAWNVRMDAGLPLSEAVAELSAAHPARAALIAAWAERWDEMLAGAVPGSVEILAELRDAGTPLYAVSNWSADTFPLAERRFDFLEWFDGVVISGRVGHAKPDPAIFRHLLAEHGLRPDELVFVDDAPRNCAAAATLGLHAIQFTGAQALRRELRALGLLSSP